MYDLYGRYVYPYTFVLHKTNKFAFFINVKKEKKCCCRGFTIYTEEKLVWYFVLVKNKINKRSQKVTLYRISLLFYYGV